MSIDHKCEGFFFLDPQLYSIDLYVYPYINITVDYRSFVVSFNVEKCELFSDFRGGYFRFLAFLYFYVNFNKNCTFYVSFCFI